MKNTTARADASTTLLTRDSGRYQRVDAAPPQVAGGTSEAALATFDGVSARRTTGMVTVRTSPTAPSSTKTPSTTR